jgi:hypothetical protein
MFSTLQRNAWGRLWMLASRPMSLSGPSRGSLCTISLQHRLSFFTLLWDLSTRAVRDTPQKCHFTLEFCILNFSIAGCPSTESLRIESIMYTRVLLITHLFAPPIMTIPRSFQCSNVLDLLDACSIIHNSNRMNCKSSNTYFICMWIYLLSSYIHESLKVLQFAAQKSPFLYHVAVVDTPLSFDLWLYNNSYTNKSRFDWIHDFHRQ